jgi:hypothetical protein
VYPRSADAETEAVEATMATDVEAAVRGKGCAGGGGVVVFFFGGGGGGGGGPPPTIFILLNYSAVVLFVALPILFIVILPADCHFLIVLQICTFTIM